jgi:hypothetical protein
MKGGEGLWRKGKRKERKGRRGQATGEKRERRKERKERRERKREIILTLGSVRFSVIGFVRLFA